MLEETAEKLLDDVEPAFAGGRGRLLDVGAGTGTLALKAAQRWPGVSVVASDASEGMLSLASGRAEDLGLGADRLSIAVGSADELPFESASFEAVVSSFALQLVPDRLAALTEIRRVLRPGGMLAYVTWLDRDSREPFRAADEFDEAVYALNMEEPDGPAETLAGDVRSPRSAAGELRRAGFVRASSREETLVYQWSLESYLAYKLEYDEWALMALLDEEQQAQLAYDARERLARLSEGDFRWQAPVVFARATAP